jgi:hypothetical protein
MNVLVWKNYGHISVYAADTADQLEGIINTIMSCMLECEPDYKHQIYLVQKHISKHKGDRQEMVKAFNTLQSDTRNMFAQEFEDIFLTIVQTECN